MLQSYKPGVGNLQLAVQIWPAALIKTVVTVRSIVNLSPALQLLVLHTYGVLLS